MAGSERVGRRIMVAVDESEESMYALQWAVDNLVNKKEHEQIIIMHAEAPAVSKLALAGHAAASAGHHVLDIAGRSENLTTQRVFSLARDICEKSNVSVETKVMTGETQYAICEAANELKVDILVVGTHGHGALKRAVVGSVSDYCTRHCKCPVLVIKKPHH
ncbi:hypothetical protein KI387_011378 [Taxus chinensis]|uniref:UspA domain-containing protein n=1 Tax=Taxus chinensis TaxID=29808 RepID=A0AA38FN34_TAXCH|nr:hypothetical protein KI387_011378 [Taxus chinensis]